MRFEKMRFEKPPLTFEQQADLLLSRGLEAERSVLENRLRAVSYYRLSGYWYPFLDADDRFCDGTSLDNIWQRYTFDRRLRVLVMDAIERIEVSVRTQLVYKFAHATGPFGYLNSSNLPKLSATQHEEWLARLAQETKRSQEHFVQRFRAKYGDAHEALPLWMASELMSFGSLLTFFRGVEPGVKQAIASEYGLPDKLVWSWLRTLNAVRNICAHHGRLWNRQWGYKPLLPNRNKFPNWHRPVPIRNDRMFVVLTMCRFWLNLIAPQSQWPRRVAGLLDDYPEIPRAAMGFPEDWEECPLWQEF
jgi:abortive infection bacteriophage resistance protein